MSVQYSVADRTESYNQELSCNLSTSKESQAVMVFPAKPGNTSRLFGDLFLQLDADVKFEYCVLKTFVSVHFFYVNLSLCKI